MCPLISLKLDQVAYLKSIGLNAAAAAAAVVVEIMGLPVDPNFEKDEYNLLERRFIIHDMQIKDPFP